MNFLKIKKLKAELMKDNSASLSIYNQVHFVFYFVFTVTQKSIWMLLYTIVLNAIFSCKCTYSLSIFSTNFLVYFKDGKKEFCFKFKEILAMFTVERNRQTDAFRVISS